MSQKSYADAAPEDRHHFITCGTCGEWIDCRSLDEVFQHETDHQPRPAIQYSGSKRVSDGEEGK